MLSYTRLYATGVINISTFMTPENPQTPPRTKSMSNNISPSSLVTSARATPAFASCRLDMTSTPYNHSKGDVLLNNTVVASRDKIFAVQHGDLSFSTGGVPSTIH